MIDREKIIKGLRFCFEKANCDECPYEVECRNRIPENHCPIMDDILALLEEQNGLARAVDQEHRVNDYLNGEIERLKALLKEQEAVRPDLGYSGDGTTWWNICGNCRTAINPNDKFCHECGKKVKWDD